VIHIFATRGDKELLLDVPVEQLPALLLEKKTNLWVDLSGPLDEDALKVARDIFHFHPLAIEDCFEAREHPKIEGFDGYVYIITHGLTPGSSAEEIDIVEIDVFLSKRYLVTYHSKFSRSINLTTELVRRAGEPLRRGPVALLHAILERQAEGIEGVLDNIEERIEDLEERVLARPHNADLGTLLALRRNTLALRRWMSKQRDVMLRLARNEFAVVSAQEALLFRDIYDYLTRFTDQLENYRDLATSVQDAYLSAANNRLGEVMKFLTVFTAVLMPLTVITGIYGMNFDHMPELRQKWGYPGILGIMAVTSASVLWFFRRRGWLGGQKENGDDAEAPPPSPRLPPSPGPP
jgi:magnesium transporter